MPKISDAQAKFIAQAARFMVHNQVLKGVTLEATANAPVEDPDDLVVVMLREWADLRRAAGVTGYLTQWDVELVLRQLLTVSDDAPAKAGSQ